MALVSLNVLTILSSLFFFVGEAYYSGRSKLIFFSFGALFFIAHFLLLPEFFNILNTVVLGVVIHFFSCAATVRAQLPENNGLKDMFPEEKKDFTSNLKNAFAAMFINSLIYGYLA